MSKTLEEYRDEMTLSYQVPKDLQEESYSQGYEDGHKQGFDEALKLDLSVKFAEWLRGEIIDTNPVDGKWVVIDEDDKSSEDLYKHWINNIYKLE